MSKPIHVNDAVQWYMSELTSHIVAKTGIPSDRYHLGKIILHSMKENDPETIMQIDCGTGQSEDNGSILKRSVKCANAMRHLGIKQGDVMVLMAPNHLDLAIPFYAALYLGVIIAPVDKSLGVGELKHIYSIYEPKIIFCQSDRLPYIKEALKSIGSDARIITFDKADEVCYLSEFLEKFGNDTSIEEFRVRFTQFPTPTRAALIVAPLQWLSALVHYIVAPFLKYPRIQSSLPMTQEHAHYIINTYRPSFLIISPTMMATLIKPRQGEQCDFTCFDIIWLGGSAVLKDLTEEVKAVAPDTEVIDVYGMSEATTLAFQDSCPPKGSCGKRIALFQYKLMNVETGKEINESNVPGELWLKGPGIVKGYYNNPEATQDAHVDGWFKSGDILYRDENWNYYFVERLKLLLKYKNHQISPVEVESVIRQHPSVLDVAVTSVPDRECGDLPVACVVRRPGHALTAQEIKDLVKDSLTDTKQLRGGVVFLNELPVTATTKLHRQKLKEIVLTMKRE